MSEKRAHGSFKQGILAVCTGASRRVVFQTCVRGEPAALLRGPIHLLIVSISGSLQFVYTESALLSYPSSPWGAALGKWRYRGCD